MKYLLLLILIGCTDADMKQYTSLGSKAHIICYSGGKIIYEGFSTGKISTEKQSDGWYFKEAKTGNLIRVSADCVIEN